MARTRAMQKAAAAEQVSEQQKKKGRGGHNKTAKKSGKAKKGLFDLPAELRNNIYLEALSSPSPIRLVFVKANPLDEDWGCHTVKIANTEIPVALLTASRQVHTEATPLLYSMNHFILDGARTLRMFLFMISHKNISQLRQITVGDSLNQNAYRHNLYGSLRMLSPATRLSKLDLPPSSLRFNYRQQMVLKALEPLMRVLKKRCESMGKKEDPIEEILQFTTPETDWQYALDLNARWVKEIKEGLKDLIG